MENANPRIDILMATYNGEAYLAEQLDSLLRQTYANWRLTVHDDGSTDQTRSIIRRYATKDPRISFLDDGVEGLGAAQNFLHLLEQVEGDYYMFCDQDDIWLPDKVMKMQQAISACNGPALVYSNSYLFANGEVQPRFSTQIHPRSLRDTLFFNSGVQGCAVIANRALLDVLRPFPKQVAMHDHLLTMGAVTFGTVRYIDEGLMWYRQHDFNTTGTQPRGLRDQVGSFFQSGKPVISRVHFEANRIFFSHYINRLDSEAKRLYNAYFRYGESRSVLKRLFILLWYGFTLGNMRGLLLLKTIMRKPIG